MRLRFAPSPTGRLHVGNARTALFNWLLARGEAGALVLRIEDTDTERSTRESEQGILDDLRWLGLDWDEGPDRGGAYGPYRQSERLPLYLAHAERLIDLDRAYYCFCPAEQIEQDRQRALEEGRVPRYRGTCRDIPVAQARARVKAGEPAAVRFRVPPRERVWFEDLVRGRVTVDAGMIGDLVLVRSDGRPSYNFAVVVDDALMAVTHVVRGEDHISNTPRQVLLYEALGYVLPQFAHLALVLGPDHAPLSKRHGATSVREFRERGYLPEALVNYLALIGWSPGANEELVPVAEMARRFSIEAVAHHAGVFDPEKLAWMNRHYMKVAQPERLARASLDYFRARGFVRTETPQAMAYLSEVMPMAAGLVDRLAQIPDRLHFLFEFDPAVALAQPQIREEMADVAAREVISALALETAESAPVRDREAFRALAARVRARTGQKGRALFHPIRVALTGEGGGPELDLAVPAIDRGADLPPSAGVAPIAGCRERARAFAAALVG